MLRALWFHIMVLGGFSVSAGEDDMATTPVQSTTLPVIDVTGTHAQIGQAIGETLRDGLRDVAESHRAGVARTVGWERAMEIAAQLIPYAERSVSDCVAELRGVASGSGVPFKTLFSMNALQETRFLAGRDGASLGPAYDDECTSLAASCAATRDGSVLLAHNEDAGSIRRALPYVVRARPTGRPAFLGFAYSGLLLYQGMNDRGIGSVGNALYARDVRPGVPKLFAYRDILDATFLEDAIRRTRKPDRANGNNHLLANEHGEIYDVEVSGGDSALHYASMSMFAHTNHIVDDRLRTVEWGDLLNSELRLHRVQRLMAQRHGSLDVDTLFAILSDHSNFPKSVCKHADPFHNPDVETVASVVIDLTAGAIHVRPGHPCETVTTTVTLAA
ncbi:MAG TPA: C45 family peptidase [Thermomicrobiales bacterium]|nr:C45 family peptidase [Thermomicrobiales bacterium]